MTREGTDIRSALRDRLEGLARIGLTSWLSVMLGNTLYVGLGAVASWIVASALSPGEFGLLALAITLLALAQESCGSGIDLAMIRLAAPHTHTDPGRARAVFSSSLRLKLVLSLVAAAALWAFEDWVAREIFGSGERTDLLRWVSVGLVGSVLYGAVLARLQAEERFRLFAVLRAANGGLRVAALALLWHLGMLSLGWAIGVSMASFWITFGLGQLAFAGQGSPADPPAAPGLWKDVIRFGRWVILSHMLFALYSRVDILLLGYFRPKAEVGSYAVAWNVMFLMDLSTYSLITSLLPRASRLHDAGQLGGQIRDTLKLSGLIAAGLVPAYLLSGPALRLLFPQYRQAPDVFHVLFWGALVTLLVHPLYLILYNRNKVASLVAVDCSLVLLALGGGLLFIPSHGWKGAAWTTVAARAWSCVLILLLVLREGRSAGPTRGPAAP